MNNKLDIKEALQMQPLSEEEKKQRHILGRLYGPIATSKENTRNGRKYNDELWNKQLNDEIFQEKIANKSLFLELGHPLDREETDMEKVCACIPEMPKSIDGDLYAYVDILDTKNGRLLKTLCDYGFVPGISSRGSGDIIGDNEVDPETFFLETWDIVQLPAVKKARLAICESLDSNKSLKQVLNESFENASKEEKENMKETLNNLGLADQLEEEKLNEAGSSQLSPLFRKGKPLESQLSWEDDPEVAESLELHEEAENESEEELDDIEDMVANEIVEDEVVEDEPIEETEEEVEEPVEEVENNEENEEVEVSVVKDYQELLNSLEAELPVEIAPVVIDGVEYEATLSLNSNEDKVIIGVNCAPIETEEEVEENGDNENIEEVEEVEAEANEEDAEVENEESEEAVDDGDDEEIIESLKESIRKSNSLEKEVKSLRNEKTVSDAMVKKLQEDLEKYKTAFTRMSNLAAKTVKSEKLAKQLQEELTQKDITIKQLESKAADNTKLNESVASSVSREKALKAKLAAVQKQADENEKTLREQLEQSNKIVAERTALAKQYRSKSAEVLDKYIESRASMLGVRPTDITNRLDESFTVADIDKACDEILTSNVNMNRLPFGLERSSKVKINESKQPKVDYNNPDNGYAIDDSLFELAGLNKSQF